MKTCQSIGIGTASFGQNYGLTNSNIKISKDAISKILNFAKKNGVNLIDTAPTYGITEQLLGEIGVKGFQIVSKVPPIPEYVIPSEAGEWLEGELINTLKNLDANCLHGLLLHKPSDLLNQHGPFFISKLTKLKENGLIKKIGFSVYCPEELDDLTKIMWPDLVQLPMNVFDRRFLNSGWIKRLSESGSEVHVRSVFLQGLLLSKNVMDNKHFKKWLVEFNAWHEYIQRNQISLIEGAIQSVLNIDGVDKIIFGVNSLANIKEIIQTFKKLTEFRNTEKLFDSSCSDLDLLDPRRWVKNI